MNVLWVVHYPSFGGPHNRVLRLEPVLAERGVHTTVVLPDLPGNATDRLRSAGLDVVQIPLGRIRETLDPREHVRLARQFAADVRKLRGLIRRHQADVVVVGGLVNAQAPVAARLENAALLWQVVDTRTPGPVRVAMMPVVGKVADTVMFGADALVDAHPGARRLEVPRVVSRPAVDTERFVPDRDRRLAAREELGVDPAAPLIGTLANVIPMKGIEYFARAAGVIRRSQPTARFVVIGALDPNHRAYQDEVYRELAQAGLGDGEVVFTDTRSDVETLLPALDVKLITSVPRSEGTTTTAMEAMACGVPVVAADVGGVKEVVAHGRTGFIVAPEDPQALAQRTLELLGDEELSERFGAAGREEAVRELGLDAAADRQMDAYQRAIEHRAARSGKTRSG